MASSSEAIVKADKAPNMPVEEMQQHSVEVIQQLHEGAETPKTGLDVTHMPSIQENLHKTAHSPEARGHAQ
ncbi:hypothetical protein HaLaN_32758 [Haematococcus lacustris]|uniref:Uncharacterized protein n=1 Tax=Haematococcus lacustris TaxID=44745 RepID=A0A6A0AKA7_HAELA|nr:hypothetical protein HaLaN_32758 [Haematococcus lacustris]